MTAGNLIYLLFALLAVLLIAGLIIYSLKMLFFRRGYIYYYFYDIRGRSVLKYFFGYVVSSIISELYRIIDKSKHRSFSDVGEVQVQKDGLAEIRIKQAEKTGPGISYNTLGYVSADGEIFRLDTGGNKIKIGHCDPEGHRKLSDFFLLKHTDVWVDSDDKPVGHCTESLRFRKKDATEVTLLARAAGVLLLYHPIIEPQEEEISHSFISKFELALPSALLFMFFFIPFHFLMKNYDLFPFIGQMVSYVAGMVLLYFLIWWIGFLIFTDLYTTDSRIVDYLILVNRNTGLRKWNSWVIILLLTGLIISVVSYGFSFTPLFIVLLIGYVCNFIYGDRSPWPLKEAIAIPYDLDSISASIHSPIKGSEAGASLIIADDDKLVHYRFTLHSTIKDVDCTIDLNLNKSDVENIRKMNPFFIDPVESGKNIKASVTKILEHADHPVLKEILKSIFKKCKEENLSSYDAYQMILSFCQPHNIDFMPDKECDEIMRADQYIRFPLETLFDKRADDDCRSVLSYSLFKEAGLPVVFLSVLGPDKLLHYAVAVGDINEDQILTSEGLIIIKGRNYYYCEPSSDGYGIGEVPVYLKSSIPGNVEILL